MRLVASVLVLSFCGCGDQPAGSLPQAPAAPYVAFAPSAGLVPSPNDAWLSDGHLDLPASACASDEMLARLDQLDGFGTFRPTFSATVSTAVTQASLAGHVLVFALSSSAHPATPSAADCVDVVALPGTTTCGELTSTIDIVPAKPLAPGRTYAVILLAGIASEAGEQLVAAPEWAERLSVTPAGDHDAWRAAQPLVDFATTAAGVALYDSAEVSVPRNHLLLAWTFTTQTVNAPLDPTVGGSPAALLEGTPDELTIDATLVLPAAIEAQFASIVGASACSTLPCEQLGAVLTGHFSAPRFTVLEDGVPGAWSDPVSPTAQGSEDVPFLAFVPAEAFLPDEANARPTVVFGHGLGRSKEDLYALAAQLASAGIASIAIDWPLHGERAVRTASSGTCAGSPNPAFEPQCFLPFWSGDLAVTRDRMRQGVLDQEKLVRILASCGPSGDCGALRVDASRLGFLGQSLGAVLGAVLVAERPELHTAVLNVGGASWLDLVAHSDTPVVRCPFVDGLIEQGVLTGIEWNLGAGGGGARCWDDDWQDEPAYLDYLSRARWLLDPAEAANYAGRLQQGHAVLLQEVLDDAVVPNLASETLASLLGLAAVPANVPLMLGDLTPSGAPGTGAASGANSWVLYDNEPTASYVHTSLLAPATPGVAATNGTAQMQVDALYYFLTNL